MDMRFRCLPCILLLIFLFLWWPCALLTQESKSGGISGHVTDCAGSPMPGADVTLTGPQGQKPVTAVIGEDGRFRFGGLSAGSYTLEVRMPGYLPVRRADMPLTPGSELTGDVVLSFNPMGGTVTHITRPALDLELPTLWRNIDAVVYLRIQKTSGVRRTGQAGSPCENVFVEHQASILEVFRRHIGKPNTTTMNFLQATPAPGYKGMTTRTEKDPLYRPGEDMVTFLRWDESEKAFLAFIALRVRDGKVQSYDIHELASAIKIEEFLKILRAMME